MVNPDKQKRALHTLQRVLASARTMALEEKCPQRLAAVLDWAELLPKLIAVDQDKTAEFREALQAIANREPRLAAAVAAFDWPEPVRW